MSNRELTKSSLSKELMGGQHTLTVLTAIADQGATYFCVKELDEEISARMAKPPAITSVHNEVKMAERCELIVRLSKTVVKAVGAPPQMVLYARSESPLWDGIIPLVDAADDMFRDEAAA